MMASDSRSRWRLSYVALCVMLVAALAVTYHTASAQPDTDRAERCRSVRAPRADALSAAFIDVARRVSPAVVFITVQRAVETPARGYGSPGQFRGFEELFPQLPDLFRRHWDADPRQRAVPGRERKRVVTGQGSGVIVSRDGYILTANHVVGGADTVWVKLEGRKQYKAKVIGADPTTDVALVKIDGDDFPWARLGDSDELEVGQWVMAIGNPLGLERTVTQGIVSATGRSGLGLSNIENYIQTDAAINMGNSGGPLVNLEGEVVGLNTAIASRRGGYEGIGFAVPVSIARRTMRRLKETGKSAWGYLGVGLDEIDPDLAEHLDITGAEVVMVEEGSPADHGGLEPGDIITRFGGERIEDVDELRGLVANTEPGTAVKLHVLRSGKREDLEVTIGSWSEEGPQDNDDASEVGLGFEVKELTPEAAEGLGFPGRRGLMVTAVDSDSAAYGKGLRAGQLIIAVNYEAVRRVADLRRQVKRAQDKDERIILTIMMKDGWVRTLLLSP